MQLEERQLVKLTIQAYKDQEFREATGTAWHVLFNPTELGFTRKNRYNAVPSAGSSEPQTSYGAGEPDEISLDLFFDGTGVVESTTSVGERVDELLGLMEFQSDTHQPYYIHLFWGRFEIRGVLTQADVKYTLFDRSGEPLRATVRITVRAVVAPDPLAREERRASPDLYQTWEVTEGDSLYGIAHAVYQSPTFWRPIAAANRLANPRVLVAGQVLILPPKVQDT